MSNSFNGDIGHTTLGLLTRKAQNNSSSCTSLHHGGFSLSHQVKQSRVVGQTSGGLNPCRSSLADDPYQSISDSKKPLGFLQEISQVFDLTQYFSSFI